MCCDGLFERLKSQINFFLLQNQLRAGFVLILMKILIMVKKAKLFSEKSTLKKKFSQKNIYF